MGTPGESLNQTLEIIILDEYVLKYVKNPLRISIF